MTTSTVENLNRHLADAMMLAAEAKAWHWSVKGATFHELHELFDQQAEYARTAGDELAERVVQLGGVPAAFPAEWQELTRLDVPANGSAPSANEMLSHYLSNLQRISNAVEADVETTDPATADILTDWLRGVEKSRWMVSATLGE